MTESTRCLIFQGLGSNIVVPQICLRTPAQLLQSWLKQGLASYLVFCAYLTSPALNGLLIITNFISDVSEGTVRKDLEHSENVQFAT